MTTLHFPASRDHALERLNAFVPDAGRQYRAKRNHDFGPQQHTSVSQLSPYIRHRVISETEVLRAVLQHHTYSAAEKFIQEVYWRTYWKGWLEHRPAVWIRYLDAVARAYTALEANADVKQAYLNAIGGQTGIETFDAWAQELVTTGYLHNHARMWFASMWIFTLQLPWELGADFFLRHLLDGDPASNTLSWRWVAGLHTKGKTYLATANNIEKYASERFFADGTPPAGLQQLARRAQALTEEPQPPATPPALPTTPEPDPNAALILTEEDLLLEAPCNPAAVAVWLPNTALPRPNSKDVKQFKQQLGEDALRHAAQRWPHATVCRQPHDTPGIVDWAQQLQLGQVMMPYVPQGHLRLQVEPLQQALRNIGCELNTFVRDHDRRAWPYASKGFFQLKKHIPDLLQTLPL